MTLLLSQGDGLLAAPSDMAWREHAACRNLSVTEATIFFPTRGQSSEVDAAKKVCATCPVTNDCLQFALDHHCLGIWGGTSERERSRLRRRRQLPTYHRR